jgi:hypothetical protein
MLVASSSSMFGQAAVSACDARFNRSVRSRSAFFLQGSTRALAQD